MGMTPDEFLDSFVEWNLADCFEQPGDIRRAFNAAVSAAHLADHYFVHSKRHKPHLVSAFANLGEFVEHLATQTSGAFRDVRSVSNVYKHLYTDEGPLARHSSVDSCGSIQLIDLDEDEGIKRLEEDFIEGSESDNRWRVMVTRKDGSQMEFLPVLETVIEFLRHLIHAPA